MVTQLGTAELAPRGHSAAQSSRHGIVLGGSAPAPLLPSVPPGPPSMWYHSVLRSPEHQCECKVMLASVATFPCLFLNLRTGLCADICVGLGDVGEKSITINWQAPLWREGLRAAPASIFPPLSKAFWKMERNLGDQTTHLAVPILQMRKPKNGGTKAQPGFKLRFPDSQCSALPIMTLCFQKPSEKNKQIKVKSLQS